MRFIPSRAAVLAALAAGFAAFLAWLRRDARQQITETLEKKDLRNANAITDRVSSARADPDSVQPYSDAGYRD
ncbi:MULTISPECIES: hypothetical protein [unclassified Phaeobacter]|uniref:hypothetical protein n=1 Tax=unclassified Phaeobacter TaxID=2621772 RepID=UPI003A8494D9